MASPMSSITFSFPLVDLDFGCRTFFTPATIVRLFAATETRLAIFGESAGRTA